MRHHLLLVLLCVAIVGCRTHDLGSASGTTMPPPDVISMPLVAGFPTLTPAQVESLRTRLSNLKFREIADLEAALPGLLFMPVSYALMSPVDANGRARPYTETTTVCRLTEDRDLVVVEDDRSGKDIIQKWFIRDLPIHR